MIHVAKRAGFEQLYDKEDGVVRQYLNLVDRKDVSMDIEDMKRRQSAPIFI